MFRLKEKILVSGFDDLLFGAYRPVISFLQTG